MQYLIKKTFTVRFPKIAKDANTMMRLDKISILEYFNLTEERHISLPQQYLVKEIVDYMDSDLHLKEFKFTLHNEIRKFKFLILNVSLLINRLEDIFSNEMRRLLKEKNINGKETLGNLYVLRRTLLCLRNLPFRYYCSDVIKFFLKRNQIKDDYTFIIENEMLKKYNKLDFSFLSKRLTFSNDLRKIENEDSEEKLNEFKKKHFLNFLLKDGNDTGDEMMYESDCEKLLAYFLAHVIDYVKF